jgi:hypothetical protein
MHGEYRIPDIIKSVDTKTRAYCEDVENDTSTIDKLIEVNNQKNKQSTLADITIDVGDFEKFLEETKVRGFDYNGAT